MEAPTIDNLKKVQKAVAWMDPEPPTEKMSRFELPGFTLPLNWTPHAPHMRTKITDGEYVSEYVEAQGEGKDLLTTALNGADRHGGYTSLPLTTLREITMMQLMNSLSDKQNWEEKIFDKSIAHKWKEEAVNLPGRDITPKMMDWVIDELRWKAVKFMETGAISGKYPFLLTYPLARGGAKSSSAFYTGDVVKSDSAVSQETKEALQLAVAALETVPEKYKDYHPGSGQKVLDLVHPSLFPLIYGQSRILENRLIGIDDCTQSCGEGVTISVRPDEETKVDIKGQLPFFLHRTAATTNDYSANFQWLPCDVDISKPGDARYTTRIKYQLAFDPDPETVPESQQPSQEEDEDEDDFWQRREDWEEAIRKAVPAEPGVFSPPPPPTKRDKDIDLVRDFGHRGLQIIVKLANIELTPERPDYEGGTWHVEGQMNEHICATALYYYDNENITESHLAFRQKSDTDSTQAISYPQNVHGWLTDIFGVTNNGPAIQTLGTTTCTENRLLTFPNILQHQVQPFSLLDGTRPGHRKILALFLVDPHLRIISTANVPPQQMGWWSEEVDRQVAGTGRALGRLSRELKDKVFRDVDDFPISLGKAKELRLQLMEERKVYVSYQKNAFEETTFSLCEH